MMKLFGAVRCRPCGNGEDAVVHADHRSVGKLPASDTRRVKLGVPNASERGKRAWRVPKPHLFFQGARPGRDQKIDIEQRPADFMSAGLLAYGGLEVVSHTWAAGGLQEKSEVSTGRRKRN